MKKLGIAIACTALVLSLTACGTYDRNRNDNRTNGVRPQSVHDNATTGDRNLNNLDGRDTMMNGQSMNDQQKRLVNSVRRVEGVNDATVVVNGQDIIVGIDVDNVGRREEVVKNVKKALQNDHNGYNVHVTAERAMHDRIRTIHGQMGNNDGQLNTYSTGNNYNDNQRHPIRNLARDIQDLLEDMGEAVTEPLR